MGSGTVTSKKIGYCRVSTEEQCLNLQKDALRNAGVADNDIYEEKASGAKEDRAVLEQALRALREGDVLVVWKLDRLARSLKQLVDIVHDLGERKIGFRCLTQSIDTTNSSGKLIFGIFAVLAEFERDLIKERTMAGLHAARAKGKVGGRPKLAAEKVAELNRRLADKESWRSIAKAMDISQATISRHRQR